MAKFSKLRLGLKISAAVLLLSMVATVVWLLNLSAAANRLDVGWAGRIPVSTFQMANSDTDGSVIAGPVGKKFIGLYKSKSGELLWRYSLDLFSSEKVVSAVSVSADGNAVAAATVQGKILILDKFANRIGEKEAGEEVAGLALSSKGKQLAQITKTGGVYVGVTESDIHKSIFQARDGERIIETKPSSDDGQIMLITNERLLLKNADGETIWEKPATAKTASFAAKNKVIAVIDQSGELLVYNNKGIINWTYRADQVKSPFENVAVSPGGKFVAVRGGGEIYLFNQAGQLINAYDFQPAQTGQSKIVFADGGERLLTVENGVFSSLLIADSRRRLLEYKEAKQFAYPGIGLMILLLIGGAGLLARLPRERHFGRLTRLPELIENEHKKVA